MPTQKSRRQSAVPALAPEQPSPRNLLRQADRALFGPAGGVPQPSPTIDQQLEEGSQAVMLGRAQDLLPEEFDGFTTKALAAYRRGLRGRRRNVAEIPIRLAEFTRAFYVGGTETQLVELLAGLPREQFDLQVGVLHRRGPLLPKVESLGLSPREFPLGSKFARPETATSIGRLAWWLLQERIEVLHVHDFAATLVAVPAAKLAGTKVVVGRLDLAHYHSRAQRAVLAQLTRLADHVVANADAIRDMLIREERIPAERISVLRNGIDLARFDAVRAEGLREPVPDTHGEPVVLHVANMNHPVKRQEDLIEAIAHVRRAGTPLHAFLVGDGPRRKELEALAQQRQVAEAIHFLGQRKDVPALYDHATIGVLCSSAEGLSNALIEAMAAAVPTVATAVGGSPELIEDGKRGLLVPAMDPKALADAFKTLLADPTRAQQLAIAARRFVEENLTRDQLISRHAELYRQLATQD